MTDKEIKELVKEADNGAGCMGIFVLLVIGLLAAMTYEKFVNDREQIRHLQERVDKLEQKKVKAVYPEN